MTAILEDGSAPARFRNLIAARYGLHFDELRLDHLADALKRAADLRGCSPGRYLALLEAGHANAELPADELTVGETYFFRNVAQFDALREIALPARLEARGGDRTLSILSAGCASGEEAFTIAMVLRESLPPHAPPPDILAVDVNPVALHRARESHYGPWAVRETPQAALERWFTRDGRGLRLADEIQKLVRFERCNLADPDAEIWSPARYDVIFCRNVIMYFTPAMQRAVVARLVRSLVPGGYLFLGHAETVRGLTDDLRLVHSHATFYYQRPSGADDNVIGDAATPTVLASTTRDIGWDAAIAAASTRIQSLTQNHRPQPVASPTIRPEALPPEQDLAEAVRLVQIGRSAAATEICAQLLDADALNAGAAYVLGLCLEASGDTARAREEYAAAIQLDPRFAMPRFRRGLLARRAGLPSADIELATAASLLDVEDSARLLLFGGGFGRSALIEMCRPQSPDLARKAG